jgi:hypothetical protein
MQSSKHISAWKTSSRKKKCGAYYRVPLPTGLLLALKVKGISRHPMIIRSELSPAVHRALYRLD